MHNCAFVYLLHIKQYLLTRVPIFTHTYVHACMCLPIILGLQLTTEHLFDSLPRHIAWQVEQELALNALWPQIRAHPSGP